MRETAETQNIKRALRGIADEFSLISEPERRLYPHLGPRSKWIDVVFSLPSGREILWIEIDQEPTQAAHNRFKIWGDMLPLIPAITVAVHHGRVAESQESYLMGVLSSGFVLPPQFLETFNITSGSYDQIERQLRSEFNRIFAYLATAPQWGTVLEIAKNYQPLVGNGSLRIAAAHLEAYSELGWFLVQRRCLSNERAACWTIALSRMLQRAGYHAEARRHIERLRQLASKPSSLSADTEEEARVVELLLNVPDFADSSSLGHLSSALNSVGTRQHQSKFLWRQAIAHTISGRSDEFCSVIEQYLNLVPDSLVAQSNANLLRTIDSILWRRRRDPLENATAYGSDQRILLDNSSGAPDGTVHGVVASLYLKILAATAQGNRNAKSLAQEVDKFCKTACVTRLADGVREIRFLLPEANSQPNLSSEVIGVLPEQLSRNRKDELTRLCARIDLVCMH